MISHAMKPRLC